MKRKDFGNRKYLYEQVYEDELNRRVRETEEEAQRRDAYERTTKKKRNRALLRTVSVFLCVLVIFLSALFLIYKFLFVITEISVEGNSIYSDGEIVSFAGVREKDNLYSFSSRIALDRLKLSCPYIKSMKVKRTPPNKILFEVEEQSPEFFCEIYGEYFILSGDLCVLECGVDLSRREGLCLLKLGAVSEAICGQTVCFTDPLVRDQAFLIANALTSSELHGRIHTADLTDKFDLDMQCDEKFLLQFGNYRDVEMKLKIASKVLADSKFDGKSKARVDLSDTSRTIATIDNTLTFD